MTRFDKLVEMLHRASKPAILIVDDDPDQLFLFRIAAERSGVFCSVTTADSANAAVDATFAMIESLPTFVRKIVLTDLKMPCVGGLELVHRLRATSQVLPLSLIAMSSSDYQPDVQAAYEAGCCAFFQKPSEFGKLKEFFGSLPETCCGTGENSTSREIEEHEITTA